MMSYPMTQEVARYQQAERLAAAERHHRLFRTPISGVLRDAGGTVIPMPTMPSISREHSAHVA